MPIRAWRFNNVRYFEGFDQGYHFFSPDIDALGGPDDLVLHADGVDEPLAGGAEYHRFLGPPVARVGVHEGGAPQEGVAQ